MAIPRVRDTSSSTTRPNFKLIVMGQTLPADTGNPQQGLPAGALGCCPGDWSRIKRPAARAQVWWRCAGRFLVKDAYAHPASAREKKLQRKDFLLSCRDGGQTPIAHLIG